MQLIKQFWNHFELFKLNWQEIVSILSNLSPKTDMLCMWPNRLITIRQKCIKIPALFKTVDLFGWSEPSWH